MAKRSQLEVGQEWAYQRSREHEYQVWGNRYEKVTIVAVEPYEKSYSGGYKTSKGNGVLVKFESRYEEVVQLSQLWKPWAEYLVGYSEYKAKWEISRAEEKVKEAKREKYRQEIYEPAMREFILAVEKISGQRVESYYKVEQFPVEVFQSITEVIKQNTATPEVA